MSRTVWINGTERLIENKDKYGVYHIYLDEKDIKWLNFIQDWRIKAIQKANSSKKNGYQKEICKIRERGKLARKAYDNFRKAL